MHLVKEKLYKSSIMLSILLLSCAVMSVILFGIQQFKTHTQLTSASQVADLSHLLVRQQANLFSMLLVNKANSERLTESLEQLTKEDFVLDASVYADNGILLAQSHTNLNLSEQLGKIDTEYKNTQQVVEPIYSANGIEGFLRVTFGFKYGQVTQNRINHLFNQLYGEIIIVFLISALFASSIHYFLNHYRRIRRQIEPIKVAKNKSVKPSLRFHRQKRRLKP